MRNTYLIDFENVGSDGLAGVTALTAEDRVIIFYSANSSRMTLRAHQQIVASAAHFDYFEVTVGGKNALDHQLGTYLGYLVATSASERYFIVSHDNGFKFLSAFWLARDPSLQISLTDNIKASLRVRPAERPRPAATPVRPVAEAPAPQPAAQREPAPEPVAQPVAPAPTPVIAAAAPAPVAEPAPVQPKPAAVTITPVLTSAPAPKTAHPVYAAPEAITPPPTPKVEEPVVAAPAPTPVSGPLPALGSQSRSAGSRRSHIRSESILATLSAAPAEAAPAAEPTAPEKEAEPVAPTAAPVQEPAPEAAPVKEPAPVTAEPAVEDAPASEPAAEPAEAPVEAAKPQEDAPKAESRSRGRTRQSTRSRRKPAARQETKADAPTEGGNAEPAETPKADAAKAAEPAAEAPKEAPAQERVHTISDAAAEAISALLQPYPKVNEGRVRELIAASKKQVLCNTLRRQLGQEQGLALYNQIKRLAWK